MEKSPLRTPARPSSTGPTPPPAFSVVAMENAPRTRAMHRTPRHCARKPKPREALAARGSVQRRVGCIAPTLKWLGPEPGSRTLGRERPAALCSATTLRTNTNRPEKTHSRLSSYADRPLLSFVVNGEKSTSSTIACELQRGPDHLLSSGKGGAGAREERAATTFQDGHKAAIVRTLQHLS